MEPSKQSSKISKLFKGLSLSRQKTIAKDKGATPSGHVATSPPDKENKYCSREKLPLPLPPVTDTICQLPYFHPHLTSKDDLTNFMSQYSLQEGYFLLRKSFKDPTSYTITVNHRCGLKHIRVVMSNGKFSLKDRSFDTIDEMIQFYSYREIPNEENIPGILLRFPIKRPPIEFGEYIIVSKGQQGTPTFLAKNLAAIGKQSSNDRPQPPIPRPPAPLPRTSNPSTPTKDSSIDQAIPSPVDPPPQEIFVPTAFGKGSVDGSSSSTLIGTPSANKTNLSTKDTVSPNPIGPSSVNDPILTTPIGTPSQCVGPSEAPPDASQNEICDCGLLMRDASLPLGWSVHVSQDSETKDQPFFLSPNNETNWDLPLSVALLLSPEQQDLIRNLGFDSDIKAAGLQHGRLITSSMGCSSRTKGWLGATPTKWVSCNDYESSKSLREAALERSEKSSHCVQSKNSESSEQTPNGDFHHPKTDRQGRRARKTERVDDCGTTLATADIKTSTVA